MIIYTKTKGHITKTFKVFDADTGHQYILTISETSPSVILDICSIISPPGGGIRYKGQEAIDFWEKLYRLSGQEELSIFIGASGIDATKALRGYQAQQIDLSGIDIPSISPGHTISLNDDQIGALEGGQPVGVEIRGKKYKIITE